MKKTQLLFLAMLALIAIALPATAHNAVLYPGKTETAVGDTVEVTASISEPLGKPDLPFYTNDATGYNFGPLALAAFKGDSASDLEISYVDIRDGARKQYSYEEVAAAFAEQKKNRPDDAAYAVMADVFNSNAVSYKIPSEGTVTFAGACSYGNVKAFAKTFVNLTADGESTKPRAAHFGFDGIELRPADDLASVKPGQSVRVEALLGGKPQKGVVVYIGYKGLGESEWLSVLSYSGAGQPAMRASVTGPDGIAALPLPEIPAGSDALGEVYIFTDGDLEVGGETRYRSTINFPLKK
ncbi:MAG: DUF4198 domain-containing protein [Synergistaceae bacterium]|jgi:hypothetical protein|nr:DUF4198 domain-containing protein [Synergistaceae bacterium]